MASKSQEKKFQCDLCDESFRAPTALGMHKRLKHGILGTSKAALHYHKTMAKAEAAPAVKTLPEPIPVKKKMGRPPLDPSERKPRKKYSKRSTQVATIPASQNGHNQPNLPSLPQWGGVASRHATETAIAVAYGRFTALCGEIAREFDLPPVTFARQFTSFISGTHP